MKRLLIDHLRGLVGAILGGVLGFYTFGWLLHQGFYGLIIPGALLGLGCGLLAGRPSAIRGVACGLAAVALALFSEWHYFPDREDDSLGYFAAHLTSRGPVTLMMIGVGGVVAFWVGKDSGFRGTARASVAEIKGESRPPADRDGSV